MRSPASSYSGLSTRTAAAVPLCDTVSAAISSRQSASSSIAAFAYTTGYLASMHPLILMLLLADPLAEKAETVVHHACENRPDETSLPFAFFGAKLNGEAVKEAKPVRGDRLEP